MQAVEHLRAAGLKEPAANIEQIARKMREQFERGGDPASGPSEERLEATLRAMLERMEQMRQQMEKMQRQVEELRAKAG
jgi:hypothetical protein